MTTRKVLPIIVTVKSPDAPEDWRDAFAIAEPGENAKIAYWADCFDFETAEPFVVDLWSKYNPDTLIAEILEMTSKLSACGVVVAGMDYLRRAKILEGLFEHLSNSHLALWGADLGSLPVESVQEFS